MQEKEVKKNKELRSGSSSKSSRIQEITKYKLNQGYIKVTGSIQENQRKTRIFERNLSTGAKIQSHNISFQESNHNTKNETRCPISKIAKPNTQTQ